MVVHFFLPEHPHVLTGNEVREQLADLKFPDDPEDCDFAEYYGVESEPTPVEPQLPVMQKDDFTSTVFEFLDLRHVPGSAEEARIPVPPSVKVGAADVRNYGGLDPPYSYSMYTYINGLKKSDTGFHPQKFVCTARGESIKPNVYIPLEEVKLRLCGEPKLRIKAFMSDFLTFINVNLRGWHQSEEIWEERGRYGISALDLANFDGRHLRTRNSAGSLVKSVAFLIELFSRPEFEELRTGFKDELAHVEDEMTDKRKKEEEQDKRDEDMLAGRKGRRNKDARSPKPGKSKAKGNKSEKDSEREGEKDKLRRSRRNEMRDKKSFHQQHRLIAFIFRRWCDVAREATYVPSESFNVSSRFWHPTLGGEPTFEFIHVVPDTDTEIWRAALQRAHDDVYNKLGTRGNQMLEERYPRARIVAVEECRNIPNVSETWIFIGAHPQLFYTTWLSSGDEADIPSQWRTFPLEYPDAEYNMYADAIKRTVEQVHKPGLRQLIGDTRTSYTRIDRGTVGAVRAVGRSGSQKSVMGDISATYFAGALFATGATGKEAEWLHRSAYSFGEEVTFENQISHSMASQNLIFGTHEANTEMIRYETYLKRLVDAWDCKIDLATGLIPFPAWADESFSWLVRGLDYEWKTELVRKDAMDTQETFLLCGNKRFPVFSRRYPSRYEAFLDSSFDKLWCPWKKVEGGPAMESPSDQIERKDLQDVIFAFVREQKKIRIQNLAEDLW